MARFFESWVIYSAVFLLRLYIYYNKKVVFTDSVICRVGVQNHSFERGTFYAVWWLIWVKFGLYEKIISLEHNVLNEQLIGKYNVCYLQGPSSWHKMGFASCNGQRQSPINLVNRLAVTSALDRIQFSNFDNIPAQMNVTNNNHTG